MPDPGKLIRPLYPPSAGGVVNGPDVEAVKRAISRMGFWKWQEFDQVYSQKFADEGVKPYQRSILVQPTGNYGAGTHDILRASKIPPGLPHSGEDAFDATACNLYKAAAAPPPTTTTDRQRALAQAVTQIGVKESPASSNHTKYGDWYGVDYQPWCAIFCTWCFETTGDSPSFVRGSRYAYVPYVVADARANRYGLTVVTSPIPGDLVCYDWGRDGTFDHIGIFEKGNAQSFTAIEGNTSYGNNSNGGEVMRRDRSSSDAAIVFVRVA